MKNKTLQLLILVGVFALIMTGYLISSMISRDDSSSDDNTSEIIMLVDLKYTNVTSVSYKRNGETVKITTDGANGIYYLENEPEFPLDKTKATSMTQAVASIGCLRLVEDTKVRFGDYGLDTPEFVITATYDTNTSITMNVGSYNSFTQSRYMNVDGTSKVYMISPSLLDYFDYSKLQLVANDTKPAIGSDEITKLTIQNKGGSKIEFTKTDDKWLTAASVEADESKIELIKRAVMGITFSTCADYGVNESPELDKYGLLTPAATVSASYVKESTVTADTSTSTVPVKTESTFTILIGSTTEDGKSVYVKLPASELVYTVSAELLSPLLQN